MTDHELLICIDAKLKELKQQFNNHLQSHFRINLMAWAAALTAIITLLALILKISL